MRVRFLLNVLDQALERYELFRQATEAARSKSLLCASPVQCLKVFDQSIESAKRAFLDSLAMDIERGASTIAHDLERELGASQSGASAQLSEQSALSRIQTDHATALSKKVFSVIQRDVGQMRSNLTVDMARAVRRSRGSNVPFSFAVQEVIATDPTSMITDSAGRRVGAERQLRLTFQEAWIDLWNLSMFYALMGRGEELAQVSRPGHEDHGLVIDIETYPALERRIFHPNSWAFMVPIDALL